MKLLIDIPEHIYEHAKESSEDSRDEFAAMRAIANGTQQESSSEIPNTCDDAISRQAVLEGIKNLYPDIPIVDIMGAKRKWLDKYAPYFECENVVEQLQSVTPQQKTGRWIKTRLDDKPDKICDDCGTYCWKCSICGCDASGWGNFKYCPNCGCKMEVKE